MVGYILAGGVLLTSIYAAIASKRERDKRTGKEKNNLQEVLSKVRSFNMTYAAFTESDRYLSGYDIFCFTAEHAALHREIKGKKYRHLSGFEKEIKLLDGFMEAYPSIGKQAAERNKEFVLSELKVCNDMFSNVEGRSLDAQQRAAIVVDQDNNLVIAGAGSGKTTTIAGKVQYLTQRLGIASDSILLISFTRKSADEMAERIRDNMKIDLPVKTFHKLGLDIIAAANGEKPSVFSLPQKAQLELIASMIGSARSKEGYLSKLLDFLAYHLKPYKNIHEFKSDAEHNNYLREQKLEGYKLVVQVNPDGSQYSYRERLKSQEEVLIANFLFRNKVEYKYEETYQYKTASKKFGQYKPDFYLPEYNIYIEHFGIDKGGKVPDFFRGGDNKTAEERYTEGIVWKRNEHAFNGTTLIETYSWEQGEGILLEQLRDKLERHGVALNPMDEEELWEYLQQNTPEDIDAFTQLTNTFLSLFKSNNETIHGLAVRALQQKDERAFLFLDLFGPILDSYIQYLNSKEEIDFSDMINVSTGLIRDNRYQSPYNYIIIDEFQDISKSRFALIKALLDQRPQTRLLCVGDDWQSIYRFAGSDIGLFTGFAEHFKSSPLTGFERTTNTSYIEKTYRFDNKLIELSGNFILKNPNQIRKSLKSSTTSTAKPFTIKRYGEGSPETNRANGPYDVLCRCLDEIGAKEEGRELTVLLMGRYDFDRKVFEGQNDFNRKFDSKAQRYDYFYGGNKSHRINFMTVHSSKGLEADYVIILNCNSGTFGFPSEISDDPLLNFLLSKADHHPNGEERRLFYVALTRAKRHVYLLASRESPSKFVEEIEKNEQVTETPCEWCDNGRLVERKGPYGYFFGCNNHHYCNFTKAIQPHVFYDRGVSSFKAGNYDAARENFERILETGKATGRTFYYLGRCCSMAKDHSKAEMYYQMAIQTGDKGADTYFHKGISSIYLAKYTDAVADLEHVAGQNSDYHQIGLWLSIAFFRNSHIIKALDYLEWELDKNPGSEQAKKLKADYRIALEKRFQKEVKIMAAETKIIKGYIKLAIELDLKIKFNYRKSEQFDGGEQSLRTVKPSGFKFVGNSDCMICHCYMRNEDRIFNLDRIENLVLNPKDIEFWSERQD